MPTKNGVLLWLGDTLTYTGNSTYENFTPFLKSVDASSLERTAWGHLSSQIICSKSESLGLSAIDILSKSLSLGEGLYSEL